MLAVNQARRMRRRSPRPTTRALQLAGGRGILKELPLERWHRDALAGPVMAASNDRCLETAGKLLCGLRAPRWSSVRPKLPPPPGPFAASIVDGSITWTKTRWLRR